MFGTVAAAGIRIIASQEINPEGYFGLGGQPLARLGGGTDAGYPEYGTGSYKGHFFFRDHDRGSCRYFCECIDTSQRR